VSALRNLTTAEVERLQADRERSVAGTHETECDAFSWCPDVLCAASGKQKPARAIRQTRVVTFGEASGDWQSPFAHTISHTHSYLRFANQDDAACPEPGCPRTLELSEQLRPTYVNVIGGQDALLRVRKAGLGGPPDAASLLAAADEAKSRPSTPVEDLTRRYVNGEVDDAEYAHKLGVLGQPIPAALQVPEAEPASQPARKPKAA
jgi:hypothetical protein